MKTFLRIIILAIIFNTFSISCADSANPADTNPAENSVLSTRPPKSGIYAIWYGNRVDVLSLPMVLGGQVKVEWKEVETAKNVYDFSLIDKLLQEVKSKGKIATVQVNGGRKPDYLFNEVPSDPKKNLMYWHPAHVQAYENLLKALGEYLAARKSDFLGVRLNYNAFGTEHWALEDPAYADASKWNYPVGAEPGIDWTIAVAEDYRKKIRDTYIKEIAPHLTVFVRNNFVIEDYPEIQQEFKNGRLSLFHTSSESEPHAGWDEYKYKNFYNYCRSGNTTAYAECWASSLGHHGSMTDDRVESMPQWFYWRLLFDLHCGVSYIAVYGNDLTVAVDGIYKLGSTVYHDDAVKGTDYKSEFTRSLNFASRYAGYHASPDVSPGAWVAFRGNTRVRNNYGLPEGQRKLNTFNDDYDFLMKRLPDNSIPVEFIGSRDTGYGSWARKLPADQKMVLEPNPEFIKSVSKPTIKITWFDDAEGKGHLNLKAGTETFTTNPERDGKWKETTFSLAGNNFANIEVQARGGDVILHMVEINR